MDFTVNPDSMRVLEELFTFSGLFGGIFSSSHARTRAGEVFKTFSLNVCLKGKEKEKKEVFFLILTSLLKQPLNDLRISYGSGGEQWMTSGNIASVFPRLFPTKPTMFSSRTNEPLFVDPRILSKSGLSQDEILDGFRSAHTTLLDVQFLSEKAQHTAHLFLYALQLLIASNCDLDAYETPQSVLMEAHKRRNVLSTQSVAQELDAIENELRIHSVVDRQELHCKRDFVLLAQHEAPEARIEDIHEQYANWIEYNRENGKRSEKQTLQRKQAHTWALTHIHKFLSEQPNNTAQKHGKANETNDQDTATDSHGSNEDFVANIY